MQRIHLCLLLLTLMGCGSTVQVDKSQTLPQARAGHRTRLARQVQSNEAPAIPPQDVFELVGYEPPSGTSAAYISPDPKDGKRHPAIIWITGGECNTIGDVWSDQPFETDQSAAAYRRAGIIMMFPSLRGGNQNPGYIEGFYGEVDDVLAAADYLQAKPYVDPQRIYLGGHSTGGSLVMLVAASTNRFRAVFAFGPVEDVSGYNEPNWVPISNSDTKELTLRSPLAWLHSIQCPTLVFEGANHPGNASSLTAMQRANSNPLVQFQLVPRKDHFNVLGLINQLLAQRVIEDTGEKTSVTITANELSNLP